MKTVRSKLTIRWIGYVVMPEHVHLMVLPQADDSDHVVTISAILHDLKGISGKSCKQALRSIWQQNRSLGTQPLDAWALGPDPKPFWKPRAHDFNIMAEAKVIEKLNYIHNNPVRRGLVDRPEQWKWGSFRYYELGDGSSITMDWDGGFPVV